MNYEKVIEEALQGKEEAFSQLYEQTQRDMYYIALKYMKNEEDALDVLQDSYIKAWRYLDMLKDPELFPAWLGRIVANTAKNVLVKKKPMLFSELESETEDGDSFAFDVEDDTIERQPELNYTQRETQELVRKMIDSLSDEQRLCILMYYLDGQSIREIAKTFDISENTVKSRLLYGRKALKNKAEELQKHGWNLYGVAPLPLLLYLLFSEKGSKTVMAAADSARIAQESEILRHAGDRRSMQGAGEKPTEQAINNTAAPSGKTSAAQTAKSIAAQSAKGAAKKTVTHTIAGKLMIAVVTVALLGGGAAGVAYFRHTANDTAEEQQETPAPENGNQDASVLNTESAEPKNPEAENPETENPETENPEHENPEPENPETENPEPENPETENPETENPETENPEPQPNETDTAAKTAETVTAPEEETVTAETSDWEPVADEAYPSLIAGNLTKEDLQFILAYGPQEIQADGMLTDDAARNIFNILIQGGDPVDGHRYLTPIDGYDTFSLSEINRLFSAFSNYQFTEENDSDTEYGVNVEGEYISFTPAQLNYTASVEIHSAEYTSEEMKVWYSYHYEMGEEVTGTAQNYTAEKTATLYPNADGLYQLKKLEDAPQQQSSTEAAVGTEAETLQSASVSDRAVADLYAGVLQSVQNKETGYDFPESADLLTGAYYYTIADIDLDGIKELLINAETSVTKTFLGCTIHVYDCEDNGSGLQLKPIEGSITALNICRVFEGEGFYTYDFASGTGMETYYREKIQNGTLTANDQPDYETRMDDTQKPQFQYFDWHDISDSSYLYGTGE